MDDDDFSDEGSDDDDEEGSVPAPRGKSSSSSKGKAKKRDKGKSSSSSSSSSSKKKKKKKKKRRSGSRGGDEDGGSSSSKRKRGGGGAASSLFDDEAEESDGGGGGGSDDDDEEEEDNEYRLDGFVVGDEDVDSDSGKRRRNKSSASSKRKRLRKAREEHGMEAADDEDLELIREAQGVIPSHNRESDRNELVASDGQDLRNQLFDGEEEEEARRQEQRQQQYHQRQRQRQERDEFDSEDDGDFIVDDLGTERRQGRRQQQESFQGGPLGASQDQVYEAMEIFGEGIQDFDLFKDVDGEDEADGKQRASKDARRQALAGIEPSLLKEKFLTDRDKMIQETDRPERLQLRMPSRGEASDAERQDEAQWIFHQLDLGFGVDEQMAKSAIEHVLRFLGVESQEVPFVWHYRRDYLWTSPQMNTYLTLDHLWKIYDLDETWDKVGNRRDKVAKASRTLWKLVDGDEDSDDENNSGYASETVDARDERLAEEETSKENRESRMRRSQLALEKAEAALTQAEDESAQGVERVNNTRLSAAQAAKKAGAEERKGDDGEEEEEEEVGEGDWERATEESLAKALEDAKDAVNHARSHVIGLKGEHAVEESEEQERNAAREARRQERKDAAAKERQARRDEARSAMEEEASLFPSDQYSYMINSQEEVELKDMQDYLALVSLMGETDEKLRNATGNGNGDRRRPRRAGRADDNLYRAARQAGLRGLANKFSITAAQLGEVVTGISQRYFPVPTPPEAVELVASDMKGAEDTPLFSSSESILQGVRHILAREIALEPRVKAKCRATYRRYALVSTTPTAKGKEEIDAFHPLYGLHYLDRKAISEFLSTHGSDRTQWLQIEKGKAEGLLTYVIHPPDNKVQSLDENGEMMTTFELNKKAFLDLLKPTYNPEGGVSSAVKQGWDHQRNLVLHEALVEHLIPALETEVVFELKAASRAAVVEEASTCLASRLMVGPYERDDLNVFQKVTKADSSLKNDQVRVVGIFVSSDSREESWAAAIDPSGSVLDHLQIPRSRDLRAKKLKAFIKSNRPHVVCVSTSAGQASRYMMDTLVDRRSGQNGEPKTGVLADAHREYQRERGDYDDQDEEEEVWKQCSLAPVKDDVACVFARSTRGEKEFADFSVNQRAAVALARYLQDPLVEFAGMWTTMDSSGNFGHEMFSLRLHALQDQVPPQQLLKVWTHRMMDAVSAVGVDINHAAEHEHAVGVLQFVPGLGPRKAFKLRERLGTVLGGVVPSRKALLSSQVLKSLVYTNAAGFLRIRERGKLAEQLEGQLDPFDDTRVHPECYNTQDWAQRICANALDVQVEDDYFPIVESAMDDSREALQRLCQQGESGVDPRMPPNNLNDSVNQLDLTAYADELQRQGEGKRAQQLDSIVEEIRYPYRDRRMPYSTPGEDELFEWLTGETDATLREGVLVPVRIMRHNDAGVRVRLEGGPGLFGFVPGDYVTDDVLPPDPITGQKADLKGVVKENQLMEAAIIKVDKGRFELKLSLRKSDTMPDPDKWDAPLGATRVFGASGWNRPASLPRLDEKFN
ncbi:GTB1; RNA binding / hydrolase, acting on ester bonds, also similar to transcription elogantion facto [Ectocarpus siliculosus]|uniref:GTB1 RNA binding / hydrolase, acting on ester bonds, also similar to transcription elogantion facto n=1 Tax=Ectocarpus siliculosus TaxID=2880 RepID=D8LQN4_ECTSI|nr:GTB1; RNA binding / hydrolase, acting on ester bonds, also similar to transcription elogantion facto [Ectocarpus siliculosus]|eukprot:CBN78798.1 GTB1; RNA binding / hydrolase, acting on ester bonds, also similar to transcription elogantion facto [Ectocarpus siliculosus]